MKQKREQKVHLFDYCHYLKFPDGHPDRLNATKCGYVRDIVTRNKKEVTCKQCLKQEVL